MAFRERTLLENQSCARHLRLRDDQLTPLKRDVPLFAGVSVRPSLTYRNCAQASPSRGCTSDPRMISHLTYISPAGNLRIGQQRPKPSSRQAPDLVALNDGCQQHVACFEKAHRQAGFVGCSHVPASCKHNRRGRGVHLAGVQRDIWCRRLIG